MRVMHAVAVAMLSLVMLPAVAAAASAEQVFQQWLAAYNSGDPQAQQRLIARHAMTGDTAPGFGLRSSLGALTLLQARSGSDTKVEMLVRADPSERGLLITLALDPARPAAVGFFQIEGAELPAAHQPARLALPSLVAQARQRLDAALAADALSGVVLLARNDEVLLSWRGGLAERSTRQPVTADTRFRLASLNKMFTAVAVLQLVQAGKLTLDDRIADHLPDFPGEDARDISVRQLLNHTAGLGDVFGEGFAQASASLKTHADYVAHYSRQPLQHPPGTQDGYSNYGYIVLGRLVEAVTGQSYYDYVATHIFAPAGMANSGFEPESADMPGRATGYTRSSAQAPWQAETASLPWRGTAAGGGYSTAADLLKFAQALQGGVLLDASLLAQATHAQNHKHWYGYGFMVSGEGGACQYGHEGGAPGQNTALWIFPDQGYVLIGLANTDPDAMVDAVNHIARRLPLQAAVDSDDGRAL